MELILPMKYLAPALHQGIMLLETLNEHGPLTLEAITRYTKDSKSTTLRLLETLGRHGWVKREESSKKYESLVLVRFKSDFSLISEDVLKKELERISQLSGCTAEWYVQRSEGMEMAQRFEPTDNPVTVKAQIGFLRKFNAEFDAVNRVAAVFGLHPTKKNTKYFCYAKPGMESILSIDIPELLKEIGDNMYTYDCNWNQNGVRRFAIGVCDKDKKLLGIVALAESYTPDADARILSKLELLKELKFKMEASEKL